MTNLDYLLITGALLLGGMAIFTMLMRVLEASMSIKTLVYSLPAG